MSKKKSVTTMKLKDFHGGSIPSDLPLPSAPGVSARPSQTASLPSRPERTRHMSSSPASKSPLPTPPRNIGRHFDEDERTPFDAPPQRHPIAAGAWASRKDQSNPATCPNPPTVWSTSKLAQASAVEKVISGKWLIGSTKPEEIINPISSKSTKRQEDETETATATDEQMTMNSLTIGSDKSKDEIISPLIRAHGSGLERPVARSGVIGENRVKSPIISQVNNDAASGSDHNNNNSSNDGGNDYYYFSKWEERPRSVGARSGGDLKGGEIGRPASHEGRQKLRLLPRSKPVENEEGKTVILKGEEDLSGLSGNELPGLNLKARAEPVGVVPDETSGNKRPSVFGGARPRELVLKERGVDDIIPQKTEKNLPTNRPNTIPLKPDPAQIKPSRNPNPNYKPHNHQPDTRTNRRVPHQPRPESDTWRKPEAPAKQETSTIPRVGKGATALELAQAFSKRVSDAGNENPVRRPENPVLFSRLCNQAPHQQINGY